MPTVRLTDIVAQHAKAVPGKQVTLWDKSLPGFGLRVGAETKSWTVVLGKGRKRVTLGRYPTMGLQSARVEAKRIILAAALVRHDPNVTSITFSEALTKFVEIRLPQKRPGTAREYERILTKHFQSVWKNRAITDIRRSDIHEVLDSLMDTPSMASHGFATVRLFFRWAQRRGYLVTSPCEGLEAPCKQAPRDRVLDKVELKKVLDAAGIGTFATIVVLLILTAQRRGEIAHLRSEWINREAGIITLPADITKNRREHTLPATPYILSLLPQTNGLLFPARDNPTAAFCGWSKSMATLRKECRVEDFTLHDLRRTAATMMAGLGTPPHIIERILNHTTGSTAHSLTPLGRIYNRHLYLNEMRDALTQWDSYVQKLRAA